MDPYGLIFVAVGAFSAAGGICDWDWFMNNRKAQAFVKLLSRKGARIFYVLLGLALVALGILVMMGTIDLSE